MAKDPIKKAENGTYYFPPDYRKTDSEIQKRIQDKKGSQRSIFKAYAYIHRGIDRKETAAILSAVH